MTYTLIIPIYNEDRTLSLLLKKLDTLSSHNIEIIIIDDGSTDGTEMTLKNHKKFNILKNESNIGKGASIRECIKSATNQNIILMDGDLEIDIDNIPRLINEFEKSNNDIVIGKRWGNKDPLSFEINRIGNYFINTLFNLLYKTNFKDILCCVRILDTKLIKSLDLQSKGFSIEVETIAKLVLRGSIIKEMKVHYNRRTFREGKKLKISDGWSIIWTAIKIKFFTKL
tara:strand:- start:4635 stop:5315 length:681 start_codon:yes stop_codon:yes gene_type:complete